MEKSIEAYLDSRDLKHMAVGVQRTVEVEEDDGFFEDLLEGTGLLVVLSIGVVAFLVWIFKRNNAKWKN